MDTQKWLSSIKEKKEMIEVLEQLLDLYVEDETGIYINLYKIRGIIKRI